MHPRVIAVGRAHPQPAAAHLQHRQRLAVQALGHAFARGARRAQERRQRRRDHRGRRGARGGVVVGEQSDGGGQAGIRRGTTQRVARLALRRDATQRRSALDLEHAEARVRHRAAPRVLDRPVERVGHFRSASPGRAGVPRARRTARSTASGTTAAASASTCSGDAGGTFAMLERRAAGGEVRQRVHEAAALVARARDDRPRGVAHIAHRVHHDERAHGHAARRLRPGAKPCLHRTRDSRRFPDGGAGSRAHGSFRDLGARGVAGVRRIGRTGPAALAARGAEIEENGRGYDRHDFAWPHGKATAARAQPGHHAVCRAQTVGRAAGEQNRVDTRHDMTGMQRVELARAGGAAARDGRGAHAARRRQHHRAPGSAARVCPMADSDAGDRSQGWHDANLVITFAP